MAKLTDINVDGIETYREYDFQNRVYRINNPVRIQFRENSTTHRVTDSEGVTHCVPAPGYNGCVVRWVGAVVA